MAMLREARFIPIEQDADETVGPDEAYFTDSGTPGTYVLGTGDKQLKASAFLKDAGSGVFTFDDAIAEEDRKLYVVDSTSVIA